MCNIKEYLEFSNQDSYLESKRSLNRMIEEGILIELGPLGPGPTLDVAYRCVATGDEYVLSHPDQAYRGFLLQRDRV